MDEPTKHSAAARGDGCQKEDIAGQPKANSLNAGWDELLRAELAALQEDDFNVRLIGSEDEELGRLLAAQDAADGLTDEDAVPELPETPISATGDLWILGDHRLLVGDATNQNDVARLMASEACDLVFTDPPYNVDREGYTEQRLTIKGHRMGPPLRTHESPRLAAAFPARLHQRYPWEENGPDRRIRQGRRRRA